VSIGRRHIFILTLIALVVFFFRLGATDLWGALVARNAQMAREMIQSGEWIVPHVNYHPDYEKPVLWIWILALFSFPLGVNEFSIRFPTALAALVSVYTVYALGRRLAGTRCGFRASLIYMTGIKVMHMARVPRIDMSLTLFIALAYYFFLRGYQEEQRRRSSYLWASFFMALSFLDKGPVGVGLPAGGMFIFLILNRDLWHLKKLVTLGNILLFLVVAAPWYVAVSVKTGGEFPRHFFLYRNVTVFALYPEAQPLWFYFPQLLVGFLPWSVFLPFAVVDAFGRKQRRSSLLPLAWFLWVFLFLTFVMYKRSDYLLPLYPAAAVLTAIFWDSIEDNSTRWMGRAVKMMVSVLLVTVICALVVVGLLSIPGFVNRVASSAMVRSYSNETDRDMISLYAGVLRRHAVLLIPIFLAASVFLFRQFRYFRARLRRMTPLLVGIALVMVFLNTYFLYAILPEVNRMISLRPYSEFLMNVIKPRDRFGLYDFWYYEFGYYMMRHVTELETPEQLRNYFEAPGVAYCLVKRKNLDEAEDVLGGVSYMVEPGLADPRGKFVMLVKQEERL
jgi:hypothetical protein